VNTVSQGTANGSAITPTFTASGSAVDPSVSIPPAKTVVILGPAALRKRPSHALKAQGSEGTYASRRAGALRIYPCDLLINATPIGMFPMVDASPFGP
jgi:hypothetical protein